MRFQAIKQDHECPTFSFEVIFESNLREDVEEFAKRNSKMFPVTVYCKETNSVLGGYGWEEEID